MEICFATNNKGKLVEIQNLVGNNFKLLSLEDIGFEGDIPETKKTIEGNAIQKSEYIFEKYNIPCFADDTGLEIEALNGEPGVYSARYAGDHRSRKDNIDLIYKKLEGKQNKNARFVTVIAFTDHNGTKTFEGITNGTILEHFRGLNGFGYDPIFVPNEQFQDDNKTLAELSMTEKNKISSRSKAFNKFLNFLKAK